MSMADDPLLESTRAKNIGNVSSIYCVIKTEPDAIAALYPSGLIRSDQGTSINRTFSSKQYVIFANLVSRQSF